MKGPLDRSGQARVNDLTWKSGPPDGAQREITGEEIVLALLCLKQFRKNSALDLASSILGLPVSLI